MKINEYLVVLVTLASRYQGGKRALIRLDSRRSGKNVMENPLDQDKGYQKFLVVGKEKNVGLKISFLSFDFSELTKEINEV